MLRSLGKNSKNFLIVFLLIIAVVLIAMIFFDSKKEATPQIDVTDFPAEASPASEVNEAAVSYQNDSTINNNQNDVFRAEVPVDIVVPEKNAVLTETEKLEIAVPVTVAPVSPNSSSRARTFEIKAQNDVFVPMKIIANVGDIVRINFTAVDKDYDLVFPSYGMKQTAAVGQTKILEFQALQAGSFSYYCEVCGGPTSGPQGNIIIVP